jgi:pimeloyl-ACP methyl ester carboxylesterase
LFDLDATRHGDDEWFAAFVGYTLARAQVRHVKATMSQLLKTGTKQVPDDELRPIGVPVDLLWGRHDRMVPLHIGEEASARFGWPLHDIDGAAHAPHIERPGTFVSTLLDTIHTPTIERNTS